MIGGWDNQGRHPERVAPFEELSGGQLAISSMPRQENSGSTATCTAIFTNLSAYLLAWCPQNTSSPPPAIMTRSLAAALHRSHRSSAPGKATVSGGGMRVGVIASSS